MSKIIVQTPPSHKNLDRELVGDGEHLYCRETLPPTSLDKELYTISLIYVNARRARLRIDQIDQYKKGMFASWRKIKSVKISNV
jgi:hypothetical protein